MTDKPKKKRGRPPTRSPEERISTKAEANAHCANILKKRAEEKKTRADAKTFAEELVSATLPVDITKLPLKTFEDYREYNHQARRQKKPVKFPAISMFPTIRTKIMRADGQRTNPIHVRIRDAELLIDYDEELSCTEVVEIPQVVAKWLNERAITKYKEVKYPDGTSETVFSHNEPRFSCQMAM